MPAKIPNGQQVPDRHPAGSAPPAQGTNGKWAPPSVPDHTLVRCIGEGAYGQVWLASDIIGTFQAVKFVYRSAFANAAPFDREFRGIQRFTPISRLHPGFVHILHVGRSEPGGYFYYIMELGDDENQGQKIVPETYSAKTLANMVRKRGKLPVGECVDLALQLTAALEFLHQHRLIHRDIKPPNIIFVNGAPKFADVGLVTEIESKPRSVTYLGTEGYIAPEGPGTPAADVFSLGKVLYEAAMGKDRLQFPDLPTTVFENADPLLLRFNEIIVKACEVNPQARYKSAAEMHQDLSVFAAK
jgi:serine/threonine protein kinase